MRFFLNPFQESSKNGTRSLSTTATILLLTWAYYLKISVMYLILGWINTSGIFNWGLNFKFPFSHYLQVNSNNSYIYFILICLPANSL
jgi:hypothetical protein